MQVKIISGLVGDDLQNRINRWLADTGYKVTLAPPLWAPEYMADPKNAQPLVHVTIWYEELPG